MRPGRPILVCALSAVALLAAAVPATSAQALGETAGPPTDYIAQADRLSQPIYPETVREKARVESFDGERIYLEIVRPDPEIHGDGPWPVILEASPYHGTIATRIGDRIFPDPVDEEGNPIGLTGYFAPRGYAVVMMDLRGTGRSTGCLDHLGPNDARDLKIVVEWLASQPWSNGRVGMTGHSYVGSTPSVAAAQRPRGLVTIVPSAGLASMYDHQFNKGVPWLLQWVGPMAAYEALALQRDLPPGFPGPLGGSTGDNWSENGPNPQTGCGMQHSSLTAGSGQVTGQYELWHARRDHGEAAADADIPIFMIHGVNDNAARIPAAEWFFDGRYLRPGDKVWLGQWNHGSGGLSSCADHRSRRVSHVNCRFDQWVHALHAWFDHHLMQRTWVDENGVERQIDTGPPVEVFLNGRATVDPQSAMYPEDKDGKVFTADAWRRYPRVTLWPDATDMSLDATEPAEAASASFGTLAEGLFFGVNRGELEFTSGPLTEDSVFVGLPRLNLNASVSSSQIVHLVTTLYREDPTGEREPMNYCAIQPQLRHGVQSVDPVIPGQEMDLPLQCFTMGHWVPAGNRLVLEVSTSSRHHASFASDQEITVVTGPGKSEYRLPRVSDPVLYDDVPLRDAA